MNSVFRSHDIFQVTTFFKSRFFLKFSKAQHCPTTRELCLTTRSREHKISMAPFLSCIYFQTMISFCNPRGLEMVIGFSSARLQTPAILVLRVHNRNHSVTKFSHFAVDSVCVLSTFQCRCRSHVCITSSASETSPHFQAQDRVSRAHSARSSASIRKP